MGSVNTLERNTNPLSLSVLANINLNFNNLSIIKGMPLHVIHVHIIAESNIKRIK